VIVLKQTYELKGWKKQMELLWEELTGGLPDGRQLAIVLIRVIAATVLGAIVGIEREKAGKPAGLRTHILVSLGTAVVVLACAASGMNMDGLSRVIQGIVTGIGFVGAGSILKVEEERNIHGLTTAAGLWMTAAIGVAAGLGSLGIAFIGTVLALIVLALQRLVESRSEKRKKEA
jgi:putative Mg2+ transporter-C (MgtC) family protein